MRLLKTVGPQTLPWLVADVLALDRHHSNVKVTDGPGDGRRDILSVDPDGQPVVTQCKFTAQRTVGSRVTDEIAIALGKFGVKQGIVATNGFLSPQAKRELLGDFPGYSMDFVEGPDLVDAILGDTALRRAWFDGEAVGRRFREVAIAMFAVDLEADKAIHLPPGTLGSSKERGVPKRYFEPLRPPAVGGMFTGRGDLVTCNLHRQPVDALAQWPEVRKLVTQSLQDSAKHGTGVRIVPIWLSGDEISDGVALAEPETVFVLDREAVPERDWLVPMIEDALFPDPYTIRSTTGAWVRFYKASLDTLIGVEFDSPPDSTQREIGELLRRQDDRLLSKSLFILRQSSDSDGALAEILSRYPPDHEQALGSGIVILGWLHTQLSSDGLRWIPATDTKEDEVEDDPSVEEIRQQLSRVSIAPMEPAVVRALIAPQLSSSRTLELTTYHLAHLAYFFTDLPSPIRIHNRRFTFERVWRVDAGEPTNGVIADWTPSMPNAAARAYYVDLDEDDQRGIALVGRLEVEPRSLLSSSAWIAANIEGAARELDGLASLASKTLRIRADTRQIWEGVSGLSFSDARVIQSERSP